MSHGARRRLELLVVEDDPGMRTLITRAGEHCGHRVTAVGSPGEALRVCGQRDFDLIVTDYLLPGGTGSELILVLRDRLVGRTPPALLVTASLDDVPAEERALFHATLEKPFRLAHLFDYLGEMKKLVRRRTRSGVIARDAAVVWPRRITGTDES